MGKAAEHFVACDLIMRGYNAFLADQGLPFDVVVVDEGKNKLCRIQVKATRRQMFTGRNPRPHYGFGLRRAKRATQLVDPNNIDVIAFVVLIEPIVCGYVDVKELISSSHGGVVQGVAFYLRRDDTLGRAYTSGKRRGMWGRFLDDYAAYPPQPHR